MDNLENKIQNILKKEVSKPYTYEYAIKNALGKNKKVNKFYNFYKVAAVSLCCLFTISGVAFATYSIYESIWKKPIEISQEETEKTIEEVRKKITSEEKASMIDEEFAKNRVENTLKILNYDNINFDKIELVRGYDSNINYVINISTSTSNNIEINIDPYTGDLLYFSDNCVISENEYTDDITEESAKDIAKNIYLKLNIINEDDNFEIISSSKQNVASGNIINNMWFVSFAKKYNDSYDESSKFTTVFKVINGNVHFYIIKGKNSENFSNNAIELSKDEAINIALEKERKFSSLEIEKVNASLDIKKMNIFIYALDNNITNENGEYQLENELVRNVWVIEIIHKKDEKPKSNDIDVVKKYYNKKYYIDTTTGEIIGGEQAEFFN